ncbi:MAG: ABC transporter permease subunit [Acidobacteriota bacterium]
MTAVSAFRVMWVCARQELTLAVRSRWTQIFAGVFACLALVVAVSGYILSGGSGVQDFARTAASLVQLVLLLVPLTALLLGVLSLASDPGSAELLFSQPVPRGVILVGRVLGLLAALVAAQMMGFGLAGLAIYSQAGDDGISGFLVVIGASVVLTAVCLNLAAWITAGNIGRRRSRALAMALVLWFSLVVLFDLVVLGAASFLRSGTASRVLIVSALVNPVDAARTGALLAIEGTAAFGAASLALLRFTGGAAQALLLVGVSLAAWLVIPLLLAFRRLSKTDI